MGTLRGRSHDRLDAVGEAFFEDTLKPRLLFAGVERVREAQRAGHCVILESTGTEHAIRPLARHLGVDRHVTRRFEFRAGIATGRVLPYPCETETRPGPRYAGGAVLVEYIFAYPGMGYLLYLGITNNDYTLIQGIVIILILGTATAVLILDLLLPVLDPRITYEKG